MYENKIKLGNRKYFVLLVIVIIGIISISPAFAEPQIEISTKFDQSLDRTVLTLTGTDFSPNFDILFDVIHDIGIDFSIGGGQLNSTSPAGNFAAAFYLAQHAESGNYIIRVVDIVKHEFKQKLELRYFPDDAISWTLTPKNFKVGESTVIDIKGKVSVATDYNRIITVLVDQPDHQWATIAEKISLTDDDEFHIAKTVNFRNPGEHLVIIEYDGLVRQNSFNVFPAESEPEILTETVSEPEPESVCGAGTVMKEGKCVVEETKESVCGAGTVMKEGKCVVEETKESANGGGCLIATATYGSELAPQVQMLREIRDNSLLQTQSGQSFMQGFNSFYYSFSPAIADYERQNPVFKEAVKVTITPLVASLSILNYVDVDSEAEVLGYGISLIMLNVGMYFVAPAIVISRIRKIKI